jgi:putative Mg2+ transporter-C (MgtC) family protein
MAEFRPVNAGLAVEYKHIESKHSNSCNQIGSAAVTNELLVMIVRIFGALAIGAIIGLERSYHGRPAGFRTHALVCMSSALLMLVTVYQNSWMTQVTIDAIRTDPTRMAQGIMTGIGFLGAGVIFKEGLTVRGLTTSASIWVTASIGILIGIGFWIPALIGAFATLLVLSAFRAIESRMPSEFYAHFHVRFRRDATMDETALRQLGGRHGFTVANMHTRLIEDGRLFEYRMVIKSRQREGAQSLSQELLSLPQVVEFRISPTGD